MSLTRKAAFDLARAQVTKSLRALDEQLAQIADDQAGDTKSSAGDKFETSREMMQQEMDRLQGQVRVVREQLLKLDLAERADRTDVASFGSLVAVANGDRYLLACGLGKVKAPAGVTLYVVSLESPVGAALIGKVAGDTATVAGRELRVV